MTIRGRNVLAKALKKHAAVRKPLAEWIEVVEIAEWQSIVDARAVWPTADAIKKTDLTCFNVGGNNFRLIAVVSYESQTVIVTEVLTHAEYDKRY